MGDIAYSFKWDISSNTQELQKSLSVTRFPEFAKPFPYMQASNLPHFRHRKEKFRSFSCLFVKFIILKLNSVRDILAIGFHVLAEILVADNTQARIMLDHYLLEIVPREDKGT